MSVVQILPIFAAVGVVLITFAVAMQPLNAKWRGAWVFPACMSVLFLVWSLFAVLTEGPLGFWAEHTRNRWGNQILFDLLLAAGIAWSVIVPRAKAQSMNVYLWLVFILCTGSIGLLATLSRLMLLEERAAAKA